MSEDTQSDKKIYEYHYVQFSASPPEKKIIKKCARKENFKTISDFVRRIVFNHIRKQSNPDLFLNGSDSASAFLLEKIAKDIKELQNNQTILLQREDQMDKLKEDIHAIKYMIEMNNLSKERKVILELLEKHSSLSQKQLAQMTEFPENVILKVIMDNNLFRITHAGRIALK